LLIGRVTSPSAKPPFLEDQFVSLNLPSLLWPVRLGRLYQEQDVTAKYKQNWINHLERMDNTRLPKHSLDEEEIVDAPGNDGNASMPEQVKRPNPWRKMIMMIFYFESAISVQSIL